MQKQLKDINKKINTFINENPCVYSKQLSNWIKNNGLSYCSIYRFANSELNSDLDDENLNDNFIKYKKFMDDILDEYIKFLSDSFSETQRLYHYTSFESACKILSTMTLRFSELNTTNDLTESHKYPYQENAANDKKLLNKTKKIVNSISQLSFSIDNKNGKFGFEILPMWGHYAKKGDGVCIVLDKKMLEQKIRNDKQIINNSEVNYNLDASKGISVKEINDALDDKNEFQQYCKENFFSKTKDWKYEQEYRILAKSKNSKFLDIKNCINSIIMYDGDNRLIGRPEYAALRKILNENIPIYLLDLAYKEGDDSVVPCNRILLPNTRDIIFPQKKNQTIELDSLM